MRTTMCENSKIRNTTYHNKNIFKKNDKLSW